MRRILPLLIASVLLGAAAAREARAQYYGDPDIIFAYDEAFGRKPQTPEKEYWRGRNLSRPKIVAELKNYLADPKNAAELRATIERTYVYSFGRRPRDDEFAYWTGEIVTHKKNYGAHNLIMLQREWLKNPANANDRARAVFSAYFNSLGREPEPGDYEYWYGRMTKEGSTYFVIAMAAATYVAGESAAQVGERRRTVLRAFKMAKVDNPSPEHVQKMEANVPKQVANMQKVLAQTPLELQFRPTFWGYVQGAKLLATGKYPTQEERAKLPEPIADKLYDCPLCH